MKEDSVNHSLQRRPLMSDLVQRGIQCMRGPWLLCSEPSVDVVAASEGGRPGDEDEETDDGEAAVSAANSPRTPAEPSGSVQQLERGGEAGGKLVRGRHDAARVRVVS